MGVLVGDVLLWLVCGLYLCFIFWLAFGCCAPQILVKIVIFRVFCAKKLKKRKKVTNLTHHQPTSLAASNPWPLPVTYNCALFCGSLLLLFHNFSTKLVNLCFSTIGQKVVLAFPFSCNPLITIDKIYSKKLFEFEMCIRFII